MHTDPSAWVCGVDEVGRGPLAGPVVAAAVILHSQRPISGLQDSKTLSAHKRQALYPCIQQQSHCWAIAQASVAEIDQLNILQASLLAMQRAVRQLSTLPTHALIDGSHIPNKLPCPATAIIQGDRTEPAIAAASILAKVYRDHLMQQWEEQYPGYGFAQHKGYPTRAHQQALHTLGPCPIHRRSFAPVQQCLIQPNSAPSVLS